MVLTAFRPAWRVQVDGTDITGLLGPRLSRLSVTDEAGVTADAVEIEVADDPFMRVAIPPPKAEIRVWMGYVGALRAMGLYVADEIEVEGPPDMLRIRGVASPHGETSSGLTPLTAQRSRSWPEGTTIGALVRQIAGEHGLRAGVSAALGRIALPHLDQVDESDIGLLSRIARARDAIAKPGGGRLLMARRGESVSASGEAMPVIPIALRDVSSWHATQALRPAAGTIIAAWRDREASTDVEVSVGEGEPIVRLRERFTSEEEALASAEAEAARTTRAAHALRLAMPGRPEIGAEARVRLLGFRPGLPAEWLVVSATHTLDGRGGFTTEIRAEVPGETL